MVFNKEYIHNKVDKVDKNLKTLSNKTSSKFFESTLQQNNPSNILNGYSSSWLLTDAEYYSPSVYCHPNI